MVKLVMFIKVKVSYGTCIEGRGRFFFEERHERSTMVKSDLAPAGVLLSALKK